MQFIQKTNNEPAHWGTWFETGTGRRSYDYKTDQTALLNLPRAKDLLLQEQNYLCAYCQSKLALEDASIEHVVPKTHNLPLSTNYYNLVAVCKETTTDPDTGRAYCEPERGDKLLPNLIFYENALVSKRANHAFFDVYTDGTIAAKPKLNQEIKKQVESFIDILNLNHAHIKEARKKDALNAILEAFKHLAPARKPAFWKNEFERVNRNPALPYRQFLLIYLAKKIGIN